MVEFNSLLINTPLYLNQSYSYCLKIILNKLDRLKYEMYEKNTMTRLTLDSDSPTFGLTKNK